MFRCVLALALLLAVPVAAPAAYGRSEAAALDPLGTEVAAAVRAVWKEAPQVDAALSRAAAAIAAEVAAGLPLDQAVRPEPLRLSLARAGAVAPEVGPVLVRANSREGALRRIRERLAGEPRTEKVGIGAVERGGTTAVVVLRAPHRVELDPFPVQVAIGTPHRLTGTLIQPLARPRVFQTPPSGAPVEQRTHVEGRRFAAVVHFAKKGRYTLEVLAEGPSGPTVAAILEVWAGEAPPDRVALPQEEPEPATVAGQEALAARLANELRQSRGLPPLRIDPVLGRVARAYAEELLRTGHFAHHSPTSGALADRLRRAGWAWRGAGENLAQAPTVRQAHQSTVASPGHLANLVQPAWTHAGFGVARGEGTVVLVQVFAVPAE